MKFTSAGVSALLLAVAGACAAGESDGGDTTFARRMADLERRSRLVPTDSLARLYTALGPTPEPVRHGVRQAVMCQYATLLATHGLAATTRAMDRMTDSLARRGLDRRQTRKLIDDGPGPNIEVSERACGVLPIPHLPDSLREPPRPTPR